MSEVFENTVEIPGVKWQRRYDKNRKYNKKWESIFPFCRKASDGSGYAYCLYCMKNIYPKKDTLLSHSKATHHISCQYRYIGKNRYRPDLKELFVKFVICGGTNKPDQDVYLQFLSVKLADNFILTKENLIRTVCEDLSVDHSTITFISFAKGDEYHKFRSKLVKKKSKKNVDVMKKDVVDCDGDVQPPMIIQHLTEENILTLSNGDKLIFMIRYPNT